MYLDTKDSLPIIAASLMSLKLATGANKIVFDITCGNGTYIKTREEARRKFWSTLRVAVKEQGTAMGLILNLFNLVAIFVANKFIKKMDVMGIF